MNDIDRSLDTTLYPEIVAHGGLGPALAAEARRDSVDLGAIAVPEGISGFWRIGIDSDRGRIGVSLGADRHVFMIFVANEQHLWAAGNADRLSEVVRVADAWRRGATLRQLHARFPFMTYTRLAQGYEDGNPVEVGWDELLEDPDLSRIRPLLRAARADDRLGRLFPSVTHLTVAKFAVDHTNREAGQVWIELTAEGGYQVGSRWVDTPRTVGTVGEAVAAAVAQLP